MAVRAGVSQRGESAGNNPSLIFNLFSPEHNFFDSHCHFSFLRSLGFSFEASLHIYERCNLFFAMDWQNNYLGLEILITFLVVRVRPDRANTKEFIGKSTRGHHGASCTKYGIRTKRTHCGPDRGI